MSKKCILCGTELDEGITLCPKCGTNHAPKTAETQPAPAKKKRKILPWILGSSFAVLIMAAILLFSFFNGSPEPTPDVPPEPAIVPAAALDNYLAVMNGDLDKVEDLAPPEYWAFHAQYSDDYLDIRKESCAMGIQDLQQTYGEYTMTGVILGEAPALEASRQKIIGALAEFGIDESAVTAVMRLTAIFTISSETNVVENPWQGLSAIEINGNWYLFTLVVMDNDADICFIPY